MENFDSEDDDFQFFYFNIDGILSLIIIILFFGGLFFNIFRIVNFFYLSLRIDDIKEEF